MTNSSTRNSLYLEQAKVLEHTALMGEQYHLRLQVPLIASVAKPGNFVHIKCAVDLPMRRPMSIMRINRNEASMDILYKVHGLGTQRLSQCVVGDILDMIGPIGKPFKLSAYRRYPLLIAGGIGLPPMIFLAEHMKMSNQVCQPLVIIGSERAFPFTRKPSQIMVDGIPVGIIAAMPLLEDWGIASRLTSLKGYSGCYDGYVTDLAHCWLDSLHKDILAQVEIFSCGPTAMLKAISKLAQDYQLPCQIALEEYMACGVGGCAGCTVLVENEQGKSMQRVCVDGPVFEANSIFPPTIN